MTPTNTVDLDITRLIWIRQCYNDFKANGFFSKNDAGSVPKKIGFLKIMILCSWKNSGFFFSKMTLAQFPVFGFFFPRFTDRGYEYRISNFISRKMIFWIFSWDLLDIFRFLALARLNSGNFGIFDLDEFHSSLNIWVITWKSLRMIPKSPTSSRIQSTF